MAVARQVIRIGAAQRAEQQLVAHRASVDEEILPERVGARERRQRGEAFDHKAFAAGADFNRIGAKLRAEDVGEPRQLAGRSRQGGGPGHRRAFLAREREGDVGPAHGETAHHVAHRFRLGAVGLQEFQPRRCRVKQIAQLHPRAVIERGGLHRRLHAAIHAQFPGMRLGPMPGGDGEAADCAD